MLILSKDSLTEISKSMFDQILGCHGLARAKLTPKINQHSCLWLCFLTMVIALEFTVYNLACSAFNWYYTHSCAIWEPSNNSLPFLPSWLCCSCCHTFYFFMCYKLCIPLSCVHKIEHCSVWHQYILTYGARPFCVFSVPPESWGFPIWLVGTGTLPSPVGACHTVSAIHFEQIFLWPQVVSSHTCREQYSAKYSRPSLCRSLEFSVCSWLSSLLCAENCNDLGILGPSAASMQAGGLTVSAWFPPPWTRAWKTLSNQETRAVMGLTSSTPHLSGITLIPSFIDFVLLELLQARGWMEHSLLLHRHKMKIEGVCVCLTLVDFT